MTDTVTPEDDGDQPMSAERFQAILNKVMPGAVFEGSMFGRGTINATAYYEERYPKFTNGRLGENSGTGGPWLTLSTPAKQQAKKELKTWQDKVRAGIYRREEMLKGVIPAVKEIARVKTYDYIFGWILEDRTLPENKLGAYPADPKDDVSLFA